MNALVLRPEEATNEITYIYFLRSGIEWKLIGLKSFITPFFQPRRAKDGRSHHESAQKWFEPEAANVGTRFSSISRRRSAEMSHGFIGLPLLMTRRALLSRRLIWSTRIVIVGISLLATVVSSRKVIIRPRIIRYISI